MYWNNFIYAFFLISEEEIRVDLEIIVLIEMFRFRFTQR